MFSSYHANGNVVNSNTHHLPFLSKRIITPRGEQRGGGGGMVETRKGSQLG